jgi:hypothetical protein
MKILHCPTDVGGNAWALSRAERKVGLDSTVMVYQTSWLGFPTDIDLHFEKSSKVGKAGKAATFFLKALAQYDIFHFNWGSSFFTNLSYLRFLEMADLPILRVLGKKIVVSFLGCDIRQRMFCTDNFAISACNEPDCYGDYCTDETDALKKRHAETFSRYAHKLFAISPDLLHFLPPSAELLPVFTVDLDQWQPVQKVKSKNFVILHAPTRRAVKGTKYIIEAVEKLRNKHKNIEFRLIENVPHNKVQEIYREADLAIDQLLLGWYGVFSVEMMALGKPVMCYIREEDLKLVPKQMKEDLPIINANPTNIYEVLERIVEERDTLTSFASRSRAYVEKWHDPVKTALRMRDTYQSLFDHDNREKAFEL